MTFFSTKEFKPHTSTPKLCTGSLFIFITLLTSCSHLKHSFNTKQLQWQAKGKISTQLLNHSQQLKRQQASFHWKQYTQGFIFEVFSPLGQRIAWLESTSKQTTLYQINQAPRSATDIDQLLFSYTGFDIPLSHFPLWLNQETQLQQDKETLLNNKQWQGIQYRYSNQQLKRLDITDKQQQRFILIIKSFTQAHNIQDDSKQAK